jgi:arylsulfatase A-like enzyme
MKNINLFIILLLFSLFSFYNCKTIAKNKQKKSNEPNIIIFLADDMGYGNLQVYGSPNIRTPNIDFLAEQGIRFTSYEAAPWCVPSRAEWMTGIYAPRVHFGGGTGAGGHGGLPDSLLTLAEGLKKAGYATGMAGKWHLGYDPKKYLPTNRGFDSWLGLPYSNDYKKPYVQTDVPLVMYRDTTVVENPVNQDSMTVKYTAEAQRFIHAHAHKQPIFFYLAYNMTHLPLHTTKEFLGKSGAGLYGDVVETIDWSVGQVLKTLVQEGLTQNTIVIFASDNGPWNDAPPRMFGIPKKPEGSAWKLRRKLYGAGNKPWDQGTSGPLRGYKHTTYGGGTRVPAMIRWPGHIKPRQVSSALVTNMDMYRTLLEIAGGKLPKYRLDGYNMMPFFTGKVSKDPRKMYAYIYNNLEGLRIGKWKLRVGPEGNLQLFNLTVDVGENYNRAEEKPKLVKKMKVKMDSVAKRIGVKVAKKSHKDAPASVPRGGYYKRYQSR